MSSPLHTQNTHADNSPHALDFDDQAGEALEQLSSLLDFVRWGASRLSQADVYFGHGTDNPWDDAVLLVTHALSLPWDLPTHAYNAVLTISERQTVLALFEQRIQARVPTPYLTGQAWFCGLPFEVDERVLIPRSPIGELIQRRFSPWWPTGREPQRILDVCCGSGCIGIAAASVFLQADVELLDISFDALAVAEQNIAQHQLGDRVVALHSDVLSAAEGRYDIIVCNPPYVDQHDMDTLPDEYRHEPELALAAGDDGLDVVHRLLACVSSYLSDDGWLVLEVGNSWPALAEAYPELPFEWVKFEHGGHGVCVLPAYCL